MNKNQKGFGALEVSLVLVVAGLIGFVGWYVSHKKDDGTSKYLTSQATTPKSNNSYQSFSRQVLNNTDKQAKDTGNGFVELEDAKIKFPKSTEFTIGYRYSVANQEGPRVVSVTDMVLMNKLLNTNTVESLKNLQDCMESIDIYLNINPPLNAKILYETQLSDGRNIKVVLYKTQCSWIH
jgi:hypothetical protein